MTIDDYAISQELGDVILELLTDSTFLNFIKTKTIFYSLKEEIEKFNNDSKKKIMFNVFDNPLLWATTIHDYGIKNNCKSDIDKKFITTQNFKRVNINTVIELSSNFFVELCCPTTKK